MQPPALSDHDYELGQQVANKMVDTGMTDVSTELSAADALWNTYAEQTGASWLLDMISGLRDTLREYAERGNDR